MSVLAMALASTESAASNRSPDRPDPGDALRQDASVSPRAFPGMTRGVIPISEYNKG